MDTRSIMVEVDINFCKFLVSLDLVGLDRLKVDTVWIGGGQWPTLNTQEIDSRLVYNGSAGQDRGGHNEQADT